MGNSLASLDSGRNGEYRPLEKAINRTDQISQNSSINDSSTFERGDKYHLRDFEPPVHGDNVLTPKELLTCWHLCKGHSRHEIANTLGVSPCTARNNANRVYKKCNVDGQIRLMAKYQAAEREAFLWALYEARQGMTLQVLGGVA